MRDVIQICGIADREEAELVIASGAEFLGFPLRLKDGREDLTEAAARDIVNAIGERAHTVAISYLSAADEVVETVSARLPICPFPALVALQAGRVLQRSLRVGCLGKVEVFYLHGELHVNGARPMAALALFLGGRGARVLEVRVDRLGDPHDVRVAVAVEAGLHSLSWVLASGIFRTMGEGR